MSHSEPSTLSRKLGFTAVFFATAIAGWQLGAGKSNSTEREALTDNDKIPTRAARAKRVYGPTAQAKQKMRTIFEAGSPEERMRATISLVHSLSITELERWLDERWFENRDGFELTLFTKLAKERWQKEDPEGFLAWSIRESSQSSAVVFSRWAEEDPLRLIAFFKKSPDARKELEALGMIAKHDPGVALARFNEMIANGEITAVNQYFSQQFLTELAASSPASLEAAMNSMPDNLRDVAEAALISESLKSDFAGGLQKLWDRPDGWKLFQAAMLNIRPEVAGDKLLSELANLPDSWKAGLAQSVHRLVSSENAAKWLDQDLVGNGFTEEQAKQFQSYAIQRLASNDPAAALQKMGEMEMSKDLRESVLQSIFSRHAKDENKTAELMALLKTDAGQNNGDASTNSSSSPPIAETPKQWIDQVANVDPAAGRNYQMLSQLRSWSKEQIAELGSQFQNLPDEKKRVVAELFSGAYGGSEIDLGLQADAIHYIVSNPVSEEGEVGRHAISYATTLTSQHVVKWGLKDPIAASQWTSSLPVGEPRLWAQKNLAANWAQYDPTAAKQWVNSLRPSDREAVTEFMKEGASK